MEQQPQSGGTPQHSLEFIKKRRFLLVLPLLMLPFMTMAFWALGGGKVSQTEAAISSVKGLNMTLPSAQFADKKDKSKMDIYQAAGKDTASKDGISSNFSHDMGFDASSAARPDLANHSASGSPATSADQQSAKIEAKLAQINRQISQPATPNTSSGANRDPQFSSDVDRMQQMMATMKSGGGNDPEMKQLSQVLKQINDLQNPGNSEDKLRSESIKNKQRAYPVVAANDDDTNENAGEVNVQNVSNAGKPKRMHENVNDNSTPNTIQAVIHNDQTLVSGAVVKLRLLDGVYVNGKLIPKGSFVYGTCALNNERLIIKIASVRYLNNILPVSLSVYDLDGLEGLFVPGSISRDAAKDGVTNAVQSMQLMSMDQNLSAQAAGAGIEAAKGLFGRKVKQIKVKVKAGYEVLLKDSNQKDY